MSTLLYNILSPDGFPISHESFKTEEKAKEYFQKWKARYIEQGYYLDSRRNRIDPSELDDLCEIVRELP